MRSAPLRPVYKSAKPSRLHAPASGGAPLVEAAAAAKETYVDWEEKLQHLLDATAPRFSCLAHAAADS